MENWSRRADAARSFKAMKKTNLREMSVDQLVERFTAIALDQDKALLRNEYAKFNRLFERMEEVKGELKARDGDQRRALLRLYDHPNAQVRLKAVKATLAVAPERARRMLEIMAESGEYPQAGDAGMTIDALDRGVFRPT
jgi:ParB-like chromosome segregation protein Spo0J